MIANTTGQNYTLPEGQTAFSWPSLYSSGPTLSRIMNFTALSTCDVILPPANLATAFQDVLISNVSVPLTGATNDIIINIYDNDNTENPLISLGTASFTDAILGQNSCYFFTTDNTTISGEWGVLPFGGPTSSVEAASITNGAGLFASPDGKLNEGIFVNPINSPAAFNILPSNRAQALVYSGGDTSWNLPPSRGNVGLFFYIVNPPLIFTASVPPTSVPSVPISLIPDGGDNINGENLSLVIIPNNSTLITTDGNGNWYTVCSTFNPTAFQSSFPVAATNAYPNPIAANKALTLPSANGLLFNCNNNIVVTLPVPVPGADNGSYFTIFNNGTGVVDTETVLVPGRLQILPPNPVTLNGIAVPATPPDPDWLSIGPLMSLTLVTDGNNWFTVNQGQTCGDVRVMGVSDDSNNIHPSDYGRTFIVTAATTSEATFLLDAHKDLLWDGFYINIYNITNEGTGVKVSAVLSYYNNIAPGNETTIENLESAQVMYDGANWWNI